MDVERNNMNEVNKQDLTRAEIYFRKFIGDNTGLIKVSVSGGALLLGFEDKEKMKNFSVDSLVIGDSEIEPIKIYIGK